MGKRLWKKASRAAAFSLAAVLTVTSVDVTAFAGPLDAISALIDKFSSNKAASTEQISGGYRLSNEYFTVETGEHGEIKTLKIVGDKFDTNYVMNAQNSPGQNTSAHEWVGELMFQTKVGDETAWTDSRTQASATGRKVELDGDKVVVTYENATGEKAINTFKVTETYSLDGDKVRWETTVTNTNEDDLTIGDWGVPLPFNEMWTQGDQIYEARTVDHSFVGKDGSYIYVTRPSGQGQFLVMTPDVSTGAGFEYQDHWRHQEREAYEKDWCQDQSGWQNGLNVFYIHSDVIKKTNRGYLENTSLTIPAGESKTYAFNFSVAQDEEDMKSILYAENLIDVVAVPGMTFSKDMPAKMYLHTKANKDDITFEIQCPHETGLHEGNAKTVNNNLPCEKTADNTYVTYNSTKVINGENYHIYDIHFEDLGQNNVVVNYKIDGEDKETVLQFYMMDNAAKAMETHAQFMVDSTQLDLPGQTGDKIYDDWMMDNKKNRYEIEKDYFQMDYWGWGDDWGLTHGEYIAEKNVYQPVPKEIKSLDEYLDIGIWNGLMREHQEDYLIHDFLVEEPNPSPTYRGYAYPHIYNTYFSMYKIASKYPDMIDYTETADTYLMRAYNIMKALYGPGVAYNWETGVMGELTTPQIIAALEKEGHEEEADNIRSIMATKYDSFKAQKYPYGSEYSYDNTGEEAVYTLAKLNAEMDNENAMRMMEAIDWKTRACRGTQPIWYRYADPVTNCGENWWQFQYTAALAGYCMDDWLRLQDNGLSAEESAEAARLNYAAKLANLTCINSGQIDADPENIGAVSWTYQAEMGNLGGQGTGGGNLHNGWRQMAGEADLGLFGAMQILSSDVANDPVFGLFGYGCTAEEAANSYVVSPLDGLNTKLNIIDEKVYVELNRDQYTEAKISKDKDSVELTVKNLEQTEHESEIVLTGLEAGTYGIEVDGTAIGEFKVTAGEANTVPVQLPAKKSAVVRIATDIEFTGSVTVNAGDDQTVAISDELKLSGTARDTDNMNKVPATKWTVESQPVSGNAVIKNDANLVTYVDVEEAGEYVFKLSATETEVSDTVTVTVTEDEALPGDIAEFDFDTLSEDGKYSINKTGYGVDAQLVGNPSVAEGVEGNGIEIKGSNTNGYVKFAKELTNRLDETTVSVDVKLTANQKNGARVMDFSDTDGNQFNIRFVNGNEIAIQANDKSVNTGVVLGTNYWKNIAVTVKDATVTLYVDGLEKAKIEESDFTFGSLGSVQRNFLGRGAEQSTAFLTGVVDNFEMKSYAMTAQEIADAYGNDAERTIVKAEANDVVTGVGEAPVLPETVSVLYSDGIYETASVTWDAVSEDSYAQAGEFTVEGTVEGLSEKVSVKVIVASGTITNLAPVATPSAIYNNPADLGGVAGLNDGYEPTSSADTSHGVWHNWGGQQSAPAWVQYTWEEDVILTGQDVYYFRDGGGNFYPSGAELYYLDQDGETWKEVKGSSGLGVALNQFNYTSFSPVKTKAIRLVITPGSLGSGVIEWKVYGYADEVIDKQALNAAIESAGAIKESFVESGYDILSAALEAARVVADSKDATQRQVNSAAEAIKDAFVELIPVDGNYAYLASPSYSFISSWETPSAVNDGYISEVSNGGGAHFGSWGNESDRESITYTWAAPVKLALAKLMIWYDGSDPTSGGIKVPKSYSYEYMDANGEWQPVSVASGGEVEVHKLAATVFEEVETTAVRLTMMKQQNDSNGVGLSEWQIFGKPEAAQKTALNDLIAVAETKTEENYTADSWRPFAEALAKAQSVSADEFAAQSEVDAVAATLADCLDGLTKKTAAGKRNIAPNAEASDSDPSQWAQENSADFMGTLAALNDNKEPSGSLGEKDDPGIWFNWMWDPDVEGHINETDWVQYDFEKTVFIDSVEAYFYKDVDTDETGVKIPAEVKYEYLDGDGNWQTADVNDDVKEDQYNTVSFNEAIETKAIRMVLRGVTALNGEAKVVSRAVGVKEWKVNGIFDGEGGGSGTTDKDVLNDWITLAEAKDSSKYSESSYADLTAAIQAAKEVAANPDASQEDVNQAKDELRAAVEALVAVVDKSTLQERYQTVSDTYKEEDYTQSSYARLTRALAKAAEVLADETATQAQINQALSQLETAVAALKAKPDSSSLAEVIARAESLKAEDYLSSSFAAMQQVLKSAKIIFEDNYSSQEDIDEAVRLLQAAIDGLLGHADYSKLQAAVDEAEAADPEGYTPESYSAYYNAVQAAKAVLANPDATQAEVDAALKAVNDAKDALVISESRTRVTYDTQGGNAIPAVVVTKGSMLQHPIPVREGYDFAGWYSKPNGRGILYDEYEPINQSVTLYACWHEQDRESAIELDKNKLTTNKIKAQIYTGKGLRPAVTVKLGKVKLEEGVDYILSYRNNINVGTEATVVIYGIGSYAGSVSKTFEIKPKSIKKASIEVFDTVMKGDQAAEPAVKIVDTQLGRTLEADKDYTLSFDMAKKKVTITGAGNYNAVIKKAFKINAEGTVLISDSAIAMEADSYVYTGKAIKPAVTVTGADGTVLTAGKDYKISYKNNKNAGTAQIIVKGKGTAKGTKIMYFTITGKDMSSAVVTLKKADNLTYTGKAVKPKMTVMLDGKKLAAGKDYTVVYRHNVRAGEDGALAGIVISGNGNYKGTVNSSFAINPLDLSSKSIKVTATKAAEPVVTVKFGKKTLTENVDYKVTYQYDTEAKKGTAVIEAIDANPNFTGTRTVSFKLKIK